MHIPSLKSFPPSLYSQNYIYKKRLRHQTITTIQRMVDEKVSKPLSFYLHSFFLYIKYGFHLPISSVSTSTNKILLWNRDWSGNSSYGCRINILGLTGVGYHYRESFMERDSIFIWCWHGLKQKEMRSLTIITNPSTMTVAHTTRRIRFNVLTLSWEAIFR